MSRLVTISEAARELGVSTKTLRRYEERGLLKPIRTMGGQRRYYLSTLREVLASAESDEDDAEPVRSHVAAPRVPDRAPPPSPSVWDEVEEEKASFEAIKVRAQRDSFLQLRQEEADRSQRELRERQESERREAQAREARERAALEQQRALREHESRLQFEMTMAELRLSNEPKESHGAIRKALLSLVSAQRIPVGTSPYRVSQLIQDEIDLAAAPYRKVRDMRAAALKYADRELADGELSSSARKRIRETVELEVLAQVTSDWTPRRAERLVDELLDDMWPEE